MRQINENSGGIGDYGFNTSLCIGIVKNNADPAEHGRLQIWIPSKDSPNYEIEDIPWAMYVSPFGGVTANFKVGREQETVPGASSYGFWAIPKNGAQVLCGFLEGDPSVRFWIGCIYMPEMNRTLPQAINGAEGPSSEIDETGVYPQKTIPHYSRNLKEAGLALGAKHFKTRGGWERSVSHPSNKNDNKPRDDGYATKPLDPDKADSQVVSITTPGRHYISMSDVDDHCRMRFKTTAGSQIILDDTNERIYISTAQGRNYIELDETNGKIYFYSSSKFNVHSENDINFYSDQNINIVAKKRVNIQSEDRGVKIQSKMGLQFLSSSADVKITASRSIHLKTINGPGSGGVGESSACNAPPYANKAMGLVRDFAEDAGSGASSVFINSVDAVEVRSDSSAVNLTGNGPINIKSIGGSVNLDASSTLNLAGGNIATRGDGVLGMFAGIVPELPVFSYQDAGGAEVSSAGSAVSGDSIRSKMVVPNHESWDRDEDESQCKTPRNKKYVS